MKVTPISNWKNTDLFYSYLPGFVLPIVLLILFIPRFVLLWCLPEESCLNHRHKLYKFYWFLEF